RTVTLSNFTGRGQLGFNIVPPDGTSTATDSAGNGDTIGFTMSPPSYVLVDNRQATTLALNVAPLFTRLGLQATFSGALTGASGPVAPGEITFTVVSRPSATEAVPET